MNLPAITTNHGLMLNSGPSILGERQVRIPVGGKIRSGIKVLTSTARSKPGAQEIYDRMASAGASWDAIEAEVKKATNLDRSPLTPRNVPYFTVRRGDFAMPEVADKIIEMYGEDRGEGVKLYRFPVILLTDSWQANLPHGFKCYTSNELVYWSEYSPDGTRFCKTRGTVEVDPRAKRAKRLFGGRPVVLRNQNNGLCVPEKCPEYQGRKCNMSGGLLFYVPGIPGASAIELGTTSFYSMQQMRQQMEIASMILGGRISGMRDGQPIFWLAKVNEEVSMIDQETGKGKRVNQWLVNLQANINMGAALALGQPPREDAIAVLEHGMDGPQEEPPQEVPPPELNDEQIIDGLRKSVMSLLTKAEIDPFVFSDYGSGKWGDGWGHVVDALTAAQDELTDALNGGIDAYKKDHGLDVPF